MVLSVLIGFGCGVEVPNTDGSEIKDGNNGSVDGLRPQEHCDDLTRLDDPTDFFSDNNLQKIARLSPVEILVPEDPTNAVAGDPRAAHLGQYLFFDERLSGSGEVSCASCHLPEHGFADPSRVSTGVGDTHRNAPSLLNSAYNVWYFLDGRSDSLWAQAIVPIEAAHEMGSSRLALAHLIDRDTQLRQAYEAIFGPMPDLSDTSRFPEEGRPVAEDPDNPQHLAWESMTDDDRHAVNLILTNVTKSIAAYEMKLTSFNADFDHFVRGLRSCAPEDLDAISDDAKSGLKFFIEDGRCLSCHAGPHFTQHTFHNLGFEEREWLPGGDLGRYEGVEYLLNDPFNSAGAYSDSPDGSAAQRLQTVFQRESKKGAFKTTMLRNVALTAPYFSGGQSDTLTDVLRFYSELDEEAAVGERDMLIKPLDLDDAKIGQIVAFLESLTGEPVSEELASQPDSPLLEQ